MATNPTTLKPVVKKPTETFPPFDIHSIYTPSANVLLFGGAGAGKTSSIISLLSNPKLKVRVLGIDNNCIAGLAYALRVARTTLVPGQLIVASLTLSEAQRRRRAKGFANALTTSDRTLVSEWIEKTFANSFIGRDFATSEEVDCGNISSFDTNTVIVFDSWTGLQSHLINEFRGTVKLESDWGVYRNVQQYAIWLLTNLQLSIDCSLIVLAHSKFTEKVKDTTELNIVPDLYGNASIQSFMGMFSDVIYCRLHKNSPVWVVQEAGTALSIRSIPFQLYPEIKPTQFPANFLDPRYTFFPLLQNESETAE